MDHPKTSKRFKTLKLRSPCLPHLLPLKLQIALTSSRCPGSLPLELTSRYRSLFRHQNSLRQGGRSKSAQLIVKPWRKRAHVVLKQNFTHCASPFANTRSYPARRISTIIFARCLTLEDKTMCTLIVLINLHLGEL